MQSETTNESWSFDSFVEWIYLNRVSVGIGLGLLILVGSGVALTKWRKNQNETNANEALFALPSALPSSRRKVEPQAGDFQKVGAEYSGTLAGERAELIAAGLLFTEGKYAEAQKQFAKFQGAHEGSPLLAQAAIGVAASLEAEGKINEAVPKYQEAISKYSSENIVSPAKLTLARLLETQNKPAEALKLYEDLSRGNNPYDSWSAEASERREQLFQKYPNLKPKPAVASSTFPMTAPAVTTNAPLPLTDKKGAK
ncbi:MAG: tetratricopeptide repeat protein [Verrucomicrobiota bacterium]